MAEIKKKTGGLERERGQMQKQEVAEVGRDKVG